MYIRGRAILPILLCGSASAYFAQVNNAHVEFVASGTTSGAVVQAAEAAGIDASPEVETAAIAPQLVQLFEEWIEEFEKEYESLEEKSKRMLVWLENHVLIESHNSQEPKASFTLGHNEFSDLTHEEFRKRMFLGEFAPELKIKEGKKFNFAPVNENNSQEDVNSRLRGASSSDGVVKAEQRKLDEDNDSDGHDWLEIGLIGPVRNQGVCGACWAFSAIGAIESAMAIGKYNKLRPAGAEGKLDVAGDLGLVVPLSEQNLIDCDTLEEHGCTGGLMITDFDEEEAKKGICSEADYPYEQTQGTCAYDMCEPVSGSIVKDHVDIVPRKTDALKEAVKKQPVTAAMVASDPMFQFYRSGIFAKAGCGDVTKTMGDAECKVLYEDQDVCLPDINHGVLVVGYGRDDTVDSDVKEYWKVKNSWGDAWGEGGFFRLARSDTDVKDPKKNWGECAILSLLSYPVMESQ